MTRKVRQQDIHHIVVNGDMVHITIVLISNGILQILCETNIMMRYMPLKDRSSIRWGRVVAAAAGYYLAPAAAGLATFFGALWVGRKLTSAFVVNGTLVGGGAVA